MKEDNILESAKYLKQLEETAMDNIAAIHRLNLNDNNIAILHIKSKYNSFNDTYTARVHIIINNKEHKIDCLEQEIKDEIMLILSKEIDTLIKAFK